MAYLLNIRLGGEREYQGEILNLTSFNDGGRKRLTMDDVHKALDVFRFASFGLIGLTFVLSFLIK
jgi:cobalamin biosynthesis protein CobD/CbiB